jgi:hypothetical protein
MRALAAGLVLMAALCMFAAIGDMVVHRLGPRGAGLLRAAALLLFVTAVVLNVASR